MSTSSHAQHPGTQPEMAVIGEPGLQVRPLRRREYEWLAEQGAFADQRVELLDGQVVYVSPQSWHHADVVARLTQTMVLALGRSALVRPQLPLVASDISMPEPDLAVVAPGIVGDHPAEAFLVIEVALSSVRIDTGLKARIYARAGIGEYWVVDLEAGEVVVHTDPDRATARYGQVRRAGAGEVLRPGALPAVELSVAEILPAATTG